MPRAGFYIGTERWINIWLCSLVFIIPLVFFFRPSTSSHIYIMIHTNLTHHYFWRIKKQKTKQMWTFKNCSITLSACGHLMSEKKKKKHIRRIISHSPGNSFQGKVANAGWKKTARSWQMMSFISVICTFSDLSWSFVYQKCDMRNIKLSKDALE